ncbi:MAG: hypothetical protein Q6367_008130 [Candidatus Freyarchaeota archaeon]
MRDENHGRALNLIRKAASGEFGIVYTSDYVFDVSVTTALKISPAMKNRGVIRKLLVGLGNPLI